MAEIVKVKSTSTAAQAVAHQNGSGAPKPKESKDAKFVRLAERRVSSALKVLRHVRQLANRQTYTYTPEQTATIVSALTIGVDSVKKAFEGDKPRTAGFSFRDHGG